MRCSNPTFLVRLKQYQPAAVLSISVAILAAPSRCAAQLRGTVELSPVMGKYIQSASLPFFLGCSVPGGSSCGGSEEQTGGIAFGGRLTAWASRRIALEGSLWYSSTSITIESVIYHGTTVVSQGTDQGSVRIVAASVRALVSLSRRAGSWVYVVGGPAVVRRYTPSYFLGFETFTSLGGVVGAGAHVRVARRLALRAEGETYLYSNSLAADHPWDYFLSLGLSVAPRIGRAATR